MTAINSEQLVYIIGLFSLITMILQAYQSIVKPQNKAEKTDAILGQQLINLQRDLVNLRDNHVHTLGMKIDKVNETVQTQAIEIGKLATIIDERIPKK